MFDFIRICDYTKWQESFEWLEDAMSIHPEENMQYLSIRQTAEKWGISVRRIQILCKEKRIPGAIRIDYSWAIPANAEKPEDARIKSGKYMKRKVDTETED